MTHVTNYIPSPSIANYVQGIFVLEQQGKSPLRMPLFANGTPTLVFYKTSEPYIDSRLTFYGQTISPDELLLRGNSTLIAYFFRPWCLPSLFRLAADELTDKPIDFSFISKGHNLEEKLLNARSTKHMLALLDDHIAWLVARSSPGDPRVEYAIDRINSSTQKDILTHVRQDLYITERSFERIFEKNIGVSPNQYRRIIQFNHAFRQFTNQTATQYLDSCPPLT